MVESQMLEQIDAHTASWSPETFSRSRILIFPSWPPSPLFPAHPLSNSFKSHFIHVQRLSSSRQKSIRSFRMQNPPTASITGLKPAGPAWGSDLCFIPLLLPSAPAQPSCPTGDSDVWTVSPRHLFCKDTKAEHVGTMWGGAVCLFICLPGFDHLFVPRHRLGKQIAVWWWTWELRKSIGSPGTWALFKNHFQPG